MNSLNVLIGPNASGKSNLIEAIGFLRASPTDLSLPIRDGGGVVEWLWKGSKSTPIAEANFLVTYPEGIMPLRHGIEFTMVGQSSNCSMRRWRMNVLTHLGKKMSGFTTVREMVTQS